MMRYGVKFGVYKNNEFIEQLFPYDAIPRIIPAEEFAFLNKGLVQRVNALNCFLNDIYSSSTPKIIKDKVIPEEFVYISSGHLPECNGIPPPKGIYSHISGIDLVQCKGGSWYVLEDNLRVPSGASYPLIARELCRIANPEAFSLNDVEDNRNYSDMLKDVMKHVNRGGLNVILTPGRYNAAYFEHSYLAERTGAVLVIASQLTVDDGALYMKDYMGGKARVGAVYRRISDEYLDPMTFEADSLIGVPHIMDAYRAGNVAIINAPGNGVADDKGIYYFVPKMIKYYLGEEAVLNNAPTYLPYYEDDLKFTLDNIRRLVIKDVSEAGGYGVVFGSNLSEGELGEIKALIKKEPRRFISQEVIDFIDLEIMDDDGGLIPRKADLRAFVLTGETTRVWESGLTRFSRDADSFIVNSSQGGGFKDTWVLSR
ncbi:MAG: circularly permuted type 2 ATP-grasp protein [Oscillospiraceae bacterium]|nr:circularly permuted type 2 ATP-grasp protein [Oscillospiraceae bacterium]